MNRSAFAPESVAEALACIPGRRDKLNVEDDKLRRVIWHVEHVLNELGPGVTTTFGYGTPQELDETSLGHGRCLAFTVASKRWIITWTNYDDDPMPLLSAPRDARAEVFSPFIDGLAPIERLIIEVADNLGRAKAERSPMLEVASRLSSTLSEAGFLEPKAR